MSKQPKNYINGAYLKKNPSFQLININFKDEFLDNLAKLPKDADGFRHVSISEQRADPLKWSIFENTYVPGQKSGGQPDDLPF